MAVFSLRRVQYIPGESDKVWSFFVDPANLPLITPPNMRFRILTSGDNPVSNTGPGSSNNSSEIYPGQLLEYRLRPLPGFWVYWMTEITQVRRGIYFVDEQRRGPYSLWHHQHHFRSVPGGVEMTDLVHYEVPFGFIGRWANALFVRRQLEGLFRYRFEVIEKMFGIYSPPA
jgi:ligand-binding SRPBCC domain-containing protein